MIKVEQAINQIYLGFRMLLNLNMIKDFYHKITNQEGFRMLLNLNMIKGGTQLRLFKKGFRMLLNLNMIKVMILNI